MKKLLPVLLIYILAISACKKDDDNSNTQSTPYKIAAGSVDLGYYCTVDTANHVLDYNHSIVLNLENNHTITFRPFTMSSPGGSEHTLDILTGTNVQYCALDNGINPRRFTDNDTISSAGNWLATTPNAQAFLYKDLHVGLPPYTTTGEWIDGQPGYVAIRLNINNSFYYGWVRIVVNGNTNFTILSWACYHP
jgi:hypothetical protein